MSINNGAELLYKVTVIKQILPLSHTQKKHPDTENINHCEHIAEDLKFNIFFSLVGVCCIPMCTHFTLSSFYTFK